MNAKKIVGFVATLLLTAGAARAEWTIMGSAPRYDLSSILYVMDRTTGAGTLVGSFDPVAPAMNGLAYNPVGQVLYGISADKDQLFRINPATAKVVPIGSSGSLGFGNANGLAYDTITGTLYGTDNNTNKLFTIDTTTGVGTAVGTVGGGFSNVEGLGFDASTGRLYGLAVGLNGTEIFGYGQILVIDQLTADATALGPALSAAHPWRGLDFDPQTDKLVACGGQGLCFIDKVTGVAAAPTGGTYVQGLAVLPEPATLSLLALGGLAMLKRKRKS